MKEKIIDYFAPKYGSLVAFIAEEEPLGTAGALGNAVGMLPQRFTVVNGDTYTPVNYGELLRFHTNNHADVTIALAKSKETRYGRVYLDGGRVIAFSEKGQDADSDLVNAGVYVIERSILSKIPLGRPVSLEREFIPSLVEEKSRVMGYTTEAGFIDIGEPDAYFHLLKNPSILEL